MPCQPLWVSPGAIAIIGLFPGDRPRLAMTLTQPRSTLESTASPPWTDAAFMALPNDGHRYEIVNHQLIDLGNSGALHGYICSTLIILLGSYIRSQKPGLLFDSSTGFKMQNGNTRSPDLAFFCQKPTSRIYHPSHRISRRRTRLSRRSIIARIIARKHRRRN